MWFFLLVTSAWVFGLVWFWSAAKLRLDLDDKVGLSVIITGVAVILGLLGVPLCKATGGLMPDYGAGTREGYLTKISKKGFFWKTWEAEMQIGSGDLAAIQAPFAFSVPYDETAEKIRANLGKRIRLEYRQWIFTPYQIGDSDYECKEVVFHPADGKDTKESKK